MAHASSARRTAVAIKSRKLSSGHRSAVLFRNAGWLAGIFMSCVSSRTNNWVEL
ncbi:uncharacterized protein H6S33_001932 [Morchella sextelata]|uniref:uncharacterized protein n=1 Tax=Morchella sextelata TaxID=1174677 RepID=UPI001D04D363|nr:uncharacterized protein H6S33_001932 [Morchella sextelata]KAH0607880.1 hypothetical protein H6S33_001932 [Morchella sextelata]